MAEYFISNKGTLTGAIPTINCIDELQHGARNLTEQQVKLEAKVEALEAETKSAHKKLRNKVHDETRSLRKKLSKETDQREAEVSNLKLTMVTRSDFDNSQKNQNREMENAYNKLHDAMIQQMNWRFWVSIACSLLIGLALGLVIQFT